jgi:hypothetical protein
MLLAMSCCVYGIGVVILSLAKFEIPVDNAVTNVIVAIVLYNLYFFIIKTP